jgi:hypothetical protein
VKAVAASRCRIVQLGYHSVARTAAPLPNTLANTTEKRTIMKTLLDKHIE